MEPVPVAPDPVDLLVIGAGPTGLALALVAADHGAQVRVIERRPVPFRPSRAMILHPLTLEVLRPSGVTGALLAHTNPSTGVRVHLGTRTVEARLDAYGLRRSPFPHPVLVRQFDVETVLAQALADRGMPVERGVELVDIVAEAELVTAHLRGGTGGTVRCRYLAGCVGAASTVRRLVGIKWDGGMYRSEVVLADVGLRGAVAPVARLVPTAAGLVFLFPLGEQAPWRLLATRPVTDPNTLSHPDPALTVEELQSLLASANVPVEISSVAWSTRIRLPHRLAAAYRRDRVFLAGDAAHAHSPAGGQGMNTGLQDAANLGWKVAYASRTGIPGEGRLLASYEAERRPVARRVRALTRLLFWAEAGTGPVPTLARGQIAPAAAGLLEQIVRHRHPGALGVWLLAQYWVNYRSSPLSSDGPRRPFGPRAGDRLPDEPVVADGRSLDLHDLLASPGVHVLLDRDAAAVDSALAHPDVRVHRLTSRRGHGIRVVRPDGYLGYASAAVDLSKVRAWLDIATGAVAA